MKNLRRLSQGLFLLLFVFLFLETESKGADELGWPVRLFLDFDPLVLLTTLLSAHAAAIAFYLSIILIIITVILGRVFCGWVCPLGTLNNMVGSMRIRAGRHLHWFGLKYYILAFLLVSSIFTLQLVGLMDPISLLIRSFSLSVHPFFSHGATALFDALYRADIRGLTDASEALYSVLKKTVLPFRQPHYMQAFFVGVLFIAVLGLNLRERRLWCRYLCPLGALLGLLSRYSLLKRSVSEGCNECGSCAQACQGGAAPDIKGGWRAEECYYCMNCDDLCPQNAVSFGFSGRKARAGLDLGRRRLITAAALGAAAVPLMRINPVTERADPGLIRPPGSLPEREFLKRCVKCGECMKVCITNGLQPALLEAGLEGIWSPVLVPTVGYCEFRCTLCGQVCPTGAIKRLPLDEKVKVKIGLAMIDRNRCLPWAHATPCIVCEEVCPTPKKAIWLEEARVRGREGGEVLLKQPRVDLELCIGCGICEAKCPVMDRPAIYVTSIGESRSEENQLLL
jgi:polyferredoxin